MKERCGCISSAAEWLQSVSVGVCDCDPCDPTQAHERRLTGLMNPARNQLCKRADVSERGTWHKEPAPQLCLSVPFSEGLTSWFAQADETFFRPRKAEQWFIYLH